MFGVIGKLRPQVEYRFWASVGHDGQTLDDLVLKLQELGNQIMEIDEEHQRVLVRRGGTPMDDVWGCRICLTSGNIVIVDSEHELILHCDNEHPHWRDS